MAFKLSQRSLGRLEGVKPELVDVVKRAIGLTTIDFGVTEGLRTEERQKELVAKKASKTMKSKHLTGDAVDLMAYIGSRASWELACYDDIIDAVKQAAAEKEVSIRWGAAWHINNIVDYEGTMEEAMNEYVDLRRSQGKRPFIDACHIEVTDIT